MAPTSTLSKRPAAVVDQDCRRCCVEYNLDDLHGTPNGDTSCWDCLSQEEQSAINKELSC